MMRIRHMPVSMMENRTNRHQRELRSALITALGRAAKPRAIGHED
jgi:hypothetical protein